MTSRRDGDLFRVKRTKHITTVLWQLITSMATMIIAPYIILYHKSFLFMGNLESATIILVIKEAADAR